MIKLAVSWKKCVCPNRFILEAIELAIFMKLYFYNQAMMILGDYPLANWTINYVQFFYFQIWKFLQI